MSILGWLASADVLQTLFDGLLGAGVGAGVAMWVLRRTLREQSRGLDAQIKAQHAALAEQLRKQDALHQEQLTAQEQHHQEQLRVQREENSRARLYAVVAEILREMMLFPAAVGKEGRAARKSVVELRLRLMAMLEQLNLEITDDERGLYETLGRLLKVVLNKSIPAYHERIDRKNFNNGLRMMTKIMTELSAWARGDGVVRAEQQKTLEKLADLAEERGILEWSKESLDRV